MESSILKFVKNVCYESHPTSCPFSIKKYALVFYCLMDVEGRYFRFIDLKLVAIYLYSFPSISMKNNTFVRVDFMKALIHIWHTKLDSAVPLSLPVEFSQEKRKQYMSQFFDNN